MRTAAEKASRSAKPKNVAVAIIDPAMVACASDSIAKTPPSAKGPNLASVRRIRSIANGPPPPWGGAAKKYDSADWKRTYMPNATAAFTAIATSSKRM